MPELARHAHPTTAYLFVQAMSISMSDFSYITDKILSSRLQERDFYFFICRS